MTGKTDVPRLSIFNTFKTKAGRMTGEAARQRAIISILASNGGGAGGGGGNPSGNARAAAAGGADPHDLPQGGGNPSGNTRTAIAQAIARENGVPWKNIYSGIFRDFDEILIPLGLVREEGRLPLKRGPKILQESGIPFYGLTERGLIAALSFDSGGRDAAVKRLFGGAGRGNGGDASMKMLADLSKFAPRLLLSIFEAYVRGYCDGKIPDMIPITSDKIRLTQGDALAVYRELLRGVSSLDGRRRRAFADFLDSVIGEGAGAQGRDAGAAGGDESPKNGGAQAAGGRGGEGRYAD